MKTTKHLTNHQLKVYFEDSLEKETKQAIGRHLLQCDFCLKRLPSPTSEQFWSALLMENDVNDLQAEKITSATRLEVNVQSLFQRSFSPMSAVVLTIVLVVVSFTFINFIKSAESLDVDNDNVVAEFSPSINTSPALERTSSNVSEKPTAVFSVTENNRSRADFNRTANRNFPVKNVASSKSKLTSRVTTNTQMTDKSLVRSNMKISTTRGSISPKRRLDETPNCSVAEIDDEKVVLKWNKVPKAVKYHLYVSDDDEILIDEFETERETFYVLNKPLDAAKTYQWKLIVTLENGETVLGNPQSFKVKNLESKRKSRKKSDTRCTKAN